MEGLLAGFVTVLQPVNIMFCFLGAVIGTLIGVLPGLGPTATIAMLLPTRAGSPAQDVANPDEDHPQSDQPEPWGRARVMLICALVALFVVGLPVIGFLVATTLLMIAFYVIGADGRFGFAPEIGRAHV